MINALGPPRIENTGQSSTVPRYNTRMEQRDFAETVDKMIKEDVFLDKLPEWITQLPPNAYGDTPCYILYDALSPNPHNLKVILNSPFDFNAKNASGKATLAAILSRLLPSHAEVVLVTQAIERLDAAGKINWGQRDNNGVPTALAPVFVKARGIEEWADLLLKLSDKPDVRALFFEPYDVVRGKTALDYLRSFSTLYTSPFAPLIEKLTTSPTD